MTDDAQRAVIIEQNDRMRRLSDTERRTLIEAGENVIGYERFCDHARQRELAQAYRRPSAGGHA